MCFFEIAIVAGYEEVASLAELDSCEKRLGAPVIQSDRDAIRLLVFAGRFLDGSLDTSRAVHDQGLLVDGIPVPDEQNDQDAKQENRDQEGVPGCMDATPAPLSSSHDRLPSFVQAVERPDIQTHAPVTRNSRPTAPRVIHNPVERGDSTGSSGSTGGGLPRGTFSPSRIAG